MLHICERGFKGTEMVQGEMCGLLVGASIALSASGNYQVLTVYQCSGGHIFTEFFRACRASTAPKHYHGEGYESIQGSTWPNRRRGKRAR